MVAQQQLSAVCRERTWVVKTSQCVCQRWIWSLSVCVRLFLKRHLEPITCRFLLTNFFLLQHPGRVPPVVSTRLSDSKWRCAGTGSSPPFTGSGGDKRVASRRVSPSCVRRCPVLRRIATGYMTGCPRRHEALKTKVSGSDNRFLLVSLSSNWMLLGRVNFWSIAPTRAEWVAELRVVITQSKAINLKTGALFDYLCFAFIPCLISAFHAQINAGKTHSMENKKITRVNAADSVIGRYMQFIA